MKQLTLSMPTDNRMDGVEGLVIVKIVLHSFQPINQIPVLKILRLMFMMVLTWRLWHVDLMPYCKCKNFRTNFIAQWGLHENFSCEKFYMYNGIPSQASEACMDLCMKE